jgi:hypothetical protein
MTQPILTFCWKKIVDLASGHGLQPCPDTHCVPRQRPEVPYSP